MFPTNEINQKVYEYLNGDYEITDTYSIPSVEEIQFGKFAKRMKLCTFYIDLRHSTNLLFSHDKQTAGKIHKSFLYIVSTTINYYDGYIRSFNGDSVLAFWPANYLNEIGNAVKAAMTIKWLIDSKLSNLFEEYEKLDFGIGIDWGPVYIIRAGLPRNANNNDLVFIGKSVNFAVALGEQAKSPYHIEISSSTYDNLEEPLIRSSLDSQSVDMWHDGTFNWQGNLYQTKLTSYHWYF